MTSREQFEKWFSENFDRPYYSDEERDKLEVYTFLAWRASRAAIEIEIPPGVDVGKFVGSDGRIMYWIEEGAVRSIIESEGLKVKK